MVLIKWFEKNKYVSWIVVIGISAIIFALSSISGLGHQDKPGTGVWSITYHISVFFFLNTFLLISLVRGRKTDFILVAIFISIVYGILDEVHQLFVSGRVSTFFDVMTNNVGIFFSTIIYIYVLSNRKNVC